MTFRYCLQIEAMGSDCARIGEITIVTEEFNYIVNSRWSGFVLLA